MEAAADPPRPPHPAPDAGFSLLEVVISLALLGVVAGAALSMFLTSLGRTDDLQERQVAIALANQTMEQANAVSSVSTSSSAVLYSGGVGTAQNGGLVAGRTKAAVLAAWDSTSFPGKNDTAPAWDSAATPGAVALPITASPAPVVANTTYTVQTFVGTCRLPDAGGDCSSSVLLGTQLQRVVVHVEWPGCGSTCTYDVTALADPHADQSWRVTS